MSTRESKIENYLVQEVTKIGGLAYKWHSPSNNGVPDRICFFPYGLIQLVEVKAPGKWLRPLQYKVIEKLRALDAEVLIIDSMENVKIFIDTIKEEINVRSEQQRSISSGGDDSKCEGIDKADDPQEERSISSVSDGGV